MFATNQENSKHQFTITNCTKYVDTNISTLFSANHHNPHLPRRNHKIYYSEETHPCLVTTISMQCNSTTLSSATTLTVNISLHMANLNMVNISSLDFHMWQHLKDHRNETQLHLLSSIPSVPIAQLYKHMISGIKPIAPFISPEESTGDTVSIWTLFSHTRVYIMGIRLLIPAELGIFCCYFFWC